MNDIDATNKDYVNPVDIKQISKADFMGGDNKDSTLAPKTVESKGNGQAQGSKPITADTGKMKSIAKSAIIDLITAAESKDAESLQKAVDLAKTQLGAIKGVGKKARIKTSITKRKVGGADIVQRSTDAVDVEKGIIPSGIKTGMGMSAGRDFAENKPGIGKYVKAAVAGGGNVQRGIFAAQKQQAGYNPQEQQLLSAANKQNVQPKEKSIPRQIGETLLSGATGGKVDISNMPADKSMRQNLMQSGVNKLKENTAAKIAAKKNKVATSQSGTFPTSGEKSSVQHPSMIKSLTDEDIVQKGLRDFATKVAGKTKEKQQSKVYGKINQEMNISKPKEADKTPLEKQPAKKFGSVVPPKNAGKFDLKNPLPNWGKKTNEMPYIPKPGEERSEVGKKDVETDELDKPTAYRKLTPEKKPEATKTPLAQKKEEVERAIQQAEEEKNRPAREAAQKEIDSQTQALRETWQGKQKLIEEEANKAKGKKTDEDVASELARRHTLGMLIGQFKKPEQKPSGIKVTPEQEAKYKVSEEAIKQGRTQPSDEKSKGAPDQSYAEQKHKEQEEAFEAQEAKGKSGFSQMSSADLAAIIKINDINDETASLLRSARNKPKEEWTSDEQDAVRDITNGKESPAPKKAPFVVGAREATQKPKDENTVEASTKKYEPPPVSSAPQEEKLSEKQLEALVKVVARGESVAAKYKKAYDAALANGDVGRIRDKLGISVSPKPEEKPKETPTSEGIVEEKQTEGGKEVNLKGAQSETSGIDNLIKTIENDANTDKHTSDEALRKQLVRALASYLRAPNSSMPETLESATHEARFVGKGLGGKIANMIKTKTESAVLSVLDAITTALTGVASTPKATTEEPKKSQRFTDGSYVTVDNGNTPYRIKHATKWNTNGKAVAYTLEGENDKEFEVNRLKKMGRESEKEEDMIKSMEIKSLKTDALLRIEKALRLINGYEPVSDSFINKAFDGMEVPKILKDEMARPPLDWLVFAINKSDVDTALGVWYGKDRVTKSEECEDDEKVASFGEPKTDYVDDDGKKEEEDYMEEKPKIKSSKEAEAQGKPGKEEKIAPLLAGLAGAGIMGAANKVFTNSMNLAMKMLQKMNVDISDMTVQELDYLGKSMIDTFDEVQKAVAETNPEGEPSEKELTRTTEGGKDFKVSDGARENVKSVTEKSKTTKDMKEEQKGKLE